MTTAERGLIKGCIRRVFGRSNMRREVIAAAIVSGYKDPKRKAVKFWVKCQGCGEMEAKSNVDVDHKEPVIPVDKTFDDMSLDEVVNRQWCDISNLQILCSTCHNKKTKEENKARRLNKVKKVK